MFPEKLAYFYHLKITRIARPYITDWVMNFTWRLKKLQNTALNTLHNFTNRVIQERKEYHQRTEYKYLKNITDNDENSDYLVYGGMYSLA